MKLADRKTQIENNSQYNAIMKRIDVLMRKGESNLTNTDAVELRALALAAEAYEKSFIPSLPGN